MTRINFAIDMRDEVFYWVEEDVLVVTSAVYYEGEKPLRNLYFSNLSEEQRAKFGEAGSSWWRAGTFVTLGTV